MIIQNESDLLDPAIRKQVIEDILATENQNRKNRAFQKYEVYKDHTNIFVIEKMLQLFDTDTVREMGYSISNVSICKKIIDKLARVYSNGCERTALTPDGKPDEALTEQIQKLSKILNVDSAMKKLNRLFKLERNMMQYVKPYKCVEDDGAVSYSFQIQSLPPFLYDVVEDPNDREKPMCIILSHFTPRKINNTTSPLTNEAVKSHQFTNLSPFGNNRDEKIADKPEDENAELDQYVWWSKHYHFTTDCKGVIIPPADVDPNVTVETQTANPIGKLPMINYAMDQDGAFWAEGGDDLVDGSILVNAMITHIMHIGVTQGYGQFFATGKNLPSAMKIGPNKGIKIEVDKEDPQPQLGFLSANPPLNDLRQLVEMYVALMLTTNNLSTSGVATQLGQAQNASSGIAMIIDKAESMEDVQDQAQIFKDNEPEMWEILAAWMEVYKAAGTLDEDLSEFSLPPEIEVEIKFPDPKPIMSEKDKLDALKARKDLGMNADWELIKQDQPSLTDEQAKQKAQAIVKDKIVKMAQASKAMGPQEGANGVPGNAGNGIKQQDSLPN